MSSVLVVCGSAPLERLAAARLSRTGMVRAGLVLVSGAFGATAVLRELPGVAAAAVFTVLLTLGQMLVLPATRALLPNLVDERRLGLFTGALASLSGLAVLAAGAPVGALLDLGGAVPWLVLGAVPLLALGCVPRGGERGERGAGSGAAAAAGVRSAPSRTNGAERGRHGGRGQGA
ncbi:hypothetical protein [Streptomyces roseoviridis]|uniref:hypothetical protein n=1 Tax=Streptomyces roseoviridis TaxID=67361 RepID=UPI0031E5929B